jgi:hypothetical protein
MYFNDNMTGKSRIRRTGWRTNSHNDSLRILASLIAQFYLKKIADSKKPDTQSADNGDLSND